MKLSTVAKRANGKLVGKDSVFTGVSIDSRTLSPGELFVAIHGPNFNGHDFIVQAERAGAIASVVSKGVSQPGKSYIQVEDTLSALKEMASLARNEFKGCMAAITGSGGKTTVKGMLNLICQQRGPCLATQGNLNNLIGVPLTLLRLTEEHKYAVVEAGTSVPGEISALAELIQADVALVNNIMPAHVEGFGSLEKIAEEKGALYDSLSAKGVAVVNLDDKFADYFLQRAKSKSVLGFSSSVASSGFRRVEKTVCGKDMSLDKFGRAQFALELDGESHGIKLQVIGAHNGQNALAASAVALSMGLSPEYIVKGLGLYTGESRRMQLRKGSRGETLIDDSYNANPGSFKAAIDYLKNLDRPVLVMGDMGELGEDAVRVHQQVGEYAQAAGLSALYATGSMSKGAANAFGSSAYWYETQAELVENLRRNLREDNVVLVKGSRSAAMDRVVDVLAQKESDN